MPVNDNVRNFFKGMFSNPVEERVVEYIVRQIENDRSVFDALEDPYVRNRIPEERRIELLADESILASFEKELRACCEAPIPADGQ